MKVLIPIIVVILLAAGGFGYWRYDAAEQQKLEDVKTAKYLETMGKLERLVADLYEPPDASPFLMQRFQDLGCKPKTAQAPLTMATRLAEAQKLLKDDPDALERLKKDETPSAQYVLALLLLKTPLAQAPAAAGLDPEALMRRAEAKGYGQARYYFARLLAGRYPIPTEDEAPDGEMFFSVNDKLEQAAEAGSGAAAYQLGFRTDPAVIKRFSNMRRAYMATRSPSEWWCRSAQLGYAPGEYSCATYGRRRRDEAKKLMQAAAEAGHPSASFALASQLAHDGTSPEIAKAKTLFCRSLYFGNAAAVGPLTKLKAQAPKTAH